MKKLWAEFKAFISRGNVIDMAVGVIIASAFTAIVTALTDGIIMPLINAAVGGDGLEGLYTVLGEPVYTTDADGNKIIDLANSIYIDWSTFLRTIIDFLLIAVILFTILKVVSTISKSGKKLQEGAAQEKVVAKRAKEIKKAEGIAYSEAKAKAEKLIAEEEAAKKAEEEAKKAKEEANKAPTTDELLIQIRDLLAAKQNEEKKD
ncbi:MAG: large conductance mechanosensitive channel protein MscL [Clostridia bacterium]|nr:large conductance mechanosensitive channel protein MscL [Clostridia bacterium]